MVASHRQDCKGKGIADLTDLPMGSERTTVEHVRQTSLHSLRWRMRWAVIHVSLMLSAAFAASCASSLPPARIGDYLASGRQADVGAFTKIDQRPLQAGLVVVSDTAEPDAAPNLPEEALVRLGENLQRDLGRAIPVAVTAVISTDRIRPEMHGDWAQFAELGRLRGLDYLGVVVVSSAEQEYPVMLFLGLTTHAQPGFRRDHWSLLEFALLDLKHDQILMQAEGRGWATLDRPSAPGIDQWYPAIFLRPQDERRIWPPSYEGASNTLRVVSFEQAAKRLVLKLQNSWREVVESETAARKARL